MTLKKVILVSIVVIICVGLGAGYYEYNKAPQDVSELKAEQVSSVDLFKKFSGNEQQANTLYLNKALEVSGTVLEVKHTQEKQVQVILDAGDPMFGIACTMDNAEKEEPLNNLKAGDPAIIKGICTGYLNDVVLIRSQLRK
jgi:hypothetical protein